MVINTPFWHLMITATQAISCNPNVIEGHHRSCTICTGLLMDWLCGLPYWFQTDWPLEGYCLLKPVLECSKVDCGTDFDLPKGTHHTTDWGVLTFLTKTHPYYKYHFLERHFFPLGPMIACQFFFLCHMPRRIFKCNVHLKDSVSSITTQDSTVMPIN